MKRIALLLCLIVSPCGMVLAQENAPEESDYYPITKMVPPPDAYPEVSGLEIGPEGELYVATRRGDIYRIGDPSVADSPWGLWARGLHESLGLSWRDGWLWATQRPELTRIRDADGDGRADLFHTVNDHWGINGDYHEYAFGSRHDREGNIWIVLCLTGSGGYSSDFRGWCVRVTPEGEMIPTASGIRSPGGIGFNAEGEVFYCDNQGLWNGSSSVKHLVPGSFQGNPSGWKAWDELDEGLLGGKPAEPESGTRVESQRARIPQFVPPACVLPHGKIGQSPTGIDVFPADGRFGPFEGQLLVGEQTHSQVQRVFLEKVNGVYQGAAFHFLSGFGSGNIAVRMDAERGVLYTGGSNRGWGARGGKPYSLDRVTWNGKTPFEVREMRARPDGFELTFTRPADPATLGDAASYAMKAYTYIYQSGYGSPEVDPVTPEISVASVGADGRSVRLVVKPMTRGHVHELHLDGVKAAAVGEGLLHPVGFYTLNEVPAE